MERKVRQWLEGAATKVTYFAVRGAVDLCGADYFVVKPFPAAIFVRALEPAKDVREEFLASRVALSEQIGPTVPAIVVVRTPEEAKGVSSADVVIPVTKLRSKARLFSSEIRLNPDVQSFLREGDPGDLDFSSGKRVEDLWSRSVSLDELTSPRAKFPSGSLAALLQRNLVEIKKRPDKQGPAKNSLEVTYLRRRLIDQYVGGMFKSVKAEAKVSDALNLLGRTPSPPRLWSGREGKHFVVCSRVINTEKKPWRLRQEVRRDLLKAWINRTILGVQKLDQVLLLGCSGREWPRGRGRHPRLWEIHQYETAGWRVFPWDFAERQPTFVGFMRGEPYVAEETV
jgi:hypothetical protein